MTLKDRVAIITGAGTIGPGVGVGKATSVVLAEQGVKLVLMDMDEARVAHTKRLVAEHGGEAVVSVGDVANVADCGAAVSLAVKTFGTVDILVNNAATSIPGTVVTLGDDDWAKVLGVTLMGAVLMARHTVPVMRSNGHGAIVNITSIRVPRGYVHAAYASAKGGLEALNARYGRRPWPRWRRSTPFNRDTSTPLGSAPLGTRPEGRGRDQTPHSGSRLLGY